jgi:hypothetical protein
MNHSEIEELRELLEQASVICSDNAHTTYKLDLIGMCNQLDEYIDELNAYENSDIYEEEDYE